MDDIYKQLADRAGRQFLDALRAVPAFKPAPGIDLGQLRITVTLLTPNGGQDLGSVDINPVNLNDVTDFTTRRGDALRAKNAQTRPTLRVLEGGSER